MERATAPAVNFLKKYNWPGNVRQLHNVVERAMNFSKGKELTKEDFQVAMTGTCAAGEKTKTKMIQSSRCSIEEARNNAEKQLIEDTLKMCGNNKTKTAECLDIARPLLYQKMKRLGIKT